jgi:hypothetical protein
MSVQAVDLVDQLFKDYICIFLFYIQGHKLLVIATASRKDVLQEMELLNVFNNVVHVSNISSGEQLMSVVENIDVFTPEETTLLAKRINGKRFVIFNVKFFNVHNF